MAFSFFRHCLLLALITLLVCAGLLSLLHPPKRTPGLLNAAIVAGKVTTLVTFTTRIDQAFQSLPLTRRAALIREHRDAIMESIGHRLPARRSFNFSRGVLLDLDPRQLRRLARQRGVWQIEFNQEIAYEVAAGTDWPQANALIPPVQMANPGFTPANSLAIIDTGLERLDATENAGIIDQVCFCSRGTGCCPNAAFEQRGTGAVRDQHGHGTAVTDLALRTHDLYSSHPLGLIEIKVLDDYPGICCPSDVAAAFDWLATHYPALDVVNASLNVGTRHPNWCDDGWGSNRLIADAVSAVLHNGTTVVAASGNEGSLRGMSAPACVPGVISVGAVYKEDYPPTKQPDWGCTETAQNENQVTCFSNSGSALDLLAPGAYLTAPWLNGTIQTERLFGTSFAAPQVAGCAAAIKARDPDLTPQEVRMLLVDSGQTVVDHRSGQEWPLFNCERVMQALITNSDHSSIEPSTKHAP